MIYYVSDPRVLGARLAVLHAYFGDHKGAGVEESSSRCTNPNTAIPDILVSGGTLRCC